MGTELFESPGSPLSDVCLKGRMNHEVYKGKVDARDDLLARILNTSVDIKEREGQLRKTTRDLRPRVVSVLRFKVGY
jgi:hypothetical protein